MVDNSNMPHPKCLGSHKNPGTEPKTCEKGPKLGFEYLPTSKTSHCVRTACMAFPKPNLVRILHEIRAQFTLSSHSHLVHISRLRIPQSFFDGVPRALRRALRERVAYHQYHLLLSVTSPRGELPMPPQCTDTIVSATSISAWFGSLRPRKTPPNPTAKTRGNRYTSPR